MAVEAHRKKDIEMNWLLIISCGILIIAIVVCAILKVHLKNRLDSIDGLVGITSRKQDDGIIIGGKIADMRKFRSASKQD